MTFEELVRQAKRIKKNSSLSDEVPTLLVERLGELVAAVAFPTTSRHESLNLIVKIGGAFQPSALTLVMDSYVDLKEAVNYSYGGLGRRFQMGDRNVNEALVLSRVEHVDGEPVVMTAINPYVRDGSFIIFKKTEYLLPNDDSYTESIWIKAMEQGLAAPSMMVKTVEVMSDMAPEEAENMNQTRFDRVTQKILENEYDCIVKLQP